MKKLLLGASMLLAMVAVSLGTYWLTVRYHKADIKQVAEQKDEHPLPVLTYATSGTDAAPAASVSDVRYDDPTIECAETVDSEYGLLKRGCELIVSDTDFQGKVALQDIEDFEYWNRAALGPNGSYTHAMRFGKYIYIVAEYGDWQSSYEDVFVSEITNTGLTSPKQIFFCAGQRQGCNPLHTDLRYGKPEYLTREEVDGYILIDLHTLQKGIMQKKLVATVELNGWNSGVICNSDPCSQGQNWAISTGNYYLRILSFERFVTQNEPWWNNPKESTHLLLDLGKAIQN